MTRQIEQLKEEIGKKDTDLVKEHFKHQKIDKETAICREGLAAVQRALAQVCRHIYIYIYINRYIVG